MTDKQQQALDKMAENAREIGLDYEPVIDKSAAIRIATALGWEPKREWVGLTDDEELKLAQDSMGKSRHWLVAQVEAKLKEKNAAPCKPLTDAEIEKICPKFEDPVRREMWVLGFKAAHGIKGGA